MGVLVAGDWQGKWICAGNGEPSSVLLRRAFRIRPGLRRAVVHVCGLGQYELTLNGVKVGRDLLTPGWTDYRKTCLYDTYDLTDALKDGDNVAGLTLGNGMYNVQPGRYTKFLGSFGAQKAIAQIRLDYADGSTETIASDARWKTHAGPITFSNTYGGEDYDARMNPDGWDRPGFDEQDWIPARETSGPGGALKGLSCAAPPIRAFDVLKPVAAKSLKKGVTVYDLGQNTSVMPHLVITGPAGSAVRIIPSELVGAAGAIDDPMCGGEAYWTYTLSGRGVETWFPQFFYRGGRYLQLELTAGPNGQWPEVKSIEGVVVHSASIPVGDFSCSNELFNRIRTLIRWSQRSNLMSILTDCPHREKLGWLEQYYLNGAALRYEWNLASLYNKGFNDMADAQTDNGLIPSIAPEYVKFGGEGDGNPFRNSPEWGSALILASWQQYVWTGDEGPFRRYYGNMKRYVDYLTTKSKDHLLDFGLGDWYDLGPKPPGPAQLTPRALTATAIYFLDIVTLEKIARLLNREVEAKSWAALAGKVRAAFNAAFFQPEVGSYATGSQTANALALVCGLAQEKDRRSVLEDIVKDVESRDNSLTAGDVGYHYLLRALADGGRSDVIYAMNNQSAKPGYGYQLKLGKTSLAEAWDGRASSSQNHFMLGHLMEWFYHDLVGIQPDPAAAGFKKVVIKPSLVADLRWAQATYDSVRGRIEVSWRRIDEGVVLRVVIPINTTATVYMPTGSASDVREGSRSADTAEGVKFLRMENGAAVYAVESGSYAFRAPSKSRDNPPKP